jgi:hypothetical protein
LKPERLVVYGDNHGGAFEGLTPPEYWSEDNKRQIPFWKWWDRLWDQLGIVDRAVCLGDMVHGKGKKGTERHLTTNLKKQCDIGFKVAEKVRAKKHSIVRGTGFHVDENMPVEDIIADRLGVPIADEEVFEIRGRSFHAKHVVGRSDTPYGQYTQLGKEMINGILKAEMMAYSGPTFFLRGHVHYSVGVDLADYGKGLVRHAWTIPCLQLPGDGDAGGFVRGLRTWLYHVGILYIEVYDKDRIFVKPILYGG